MSEDFQVSVIIPVYNAATRVRRAVESALALPEVAEVILVEDGSPDGALKVCTELAAQYPQVRSFQHPDGRNHGAGASRNLAVSHARFPYVAFLDADDWWLPNRFEADSRLLETDPTLDGVYNAIGHKYLNEEVHARWQAQGRPEILTVSAPVPPEELVFVLLWSHPRVRGEFSTIAVTVRRSFFDRIGGFLPELRLQQDTHLWKRMAAGGRLAAGSIVEPVAMQDVHGDNRMTKVEDHYAYLDLWWSTLGRAFRDMRVSPAVMQAWRRGYATHRARRGPRWKAVAGLMSWAMREPSQIRIPYGHFDLTLRSIFDSHSAVNRMLSAKNRMLARNSLTAMRTLVANIPMRRNRFLRDLNSAISNLCDLHHSSDDFWNMQGDYDVVHLHWPEYITYEIEAAYNSVLDQSLMAALQERLHFWSSRSAIVVTRHNPFPYNAPESREWARVYELVFSHADGVVHMGQNSIADFRERYGVAMSRRGEDVRHTVIAHQNYASLPNDIERPAARASFGIPENAQVVLVFGAIRTDAERKLILSAFRQVSNKRKILLVSSWRHGIPRIRSGRLTKLVTKGTRLYHHLHSRYYFDYGFVDESDAQLFVNASDVLFIPRLQVLNSANVSLGMTFGRVVVGPDLGNVGEILKETENPVYDPLDSETAARAIEKGLSLARDGKLGEKNRQVAMAEWDVGRCAVKYVEFYREVAAAASAPI